MSNRTSCIDGKELKFAIANIIYNQPGSTDLPLVINSRCEVDRDRYADLLSALYDEYLTLDEFIKSKRSWNDDDFSKAIDHATIIANSIRNLDKEDLEIYFKGYATKTKLRNVLALEEELRKSSNQLKELDQNNVIINLSELGVSIVDKGLFMSKKQTYKALDFVQTVLCAMHGIDIANEKLNQTVLNVQYDKIEECENFYYRFLTSEQEEKLSLLNELAIKFLSLPKDIIKYSAYKSENEDFDKILDCVKVVLNAQEDPKALEKEIKTVKSFFAKEDHPSDHVMAMKALFLQYCGYDINKTFKGYIQKVYNVAQKANEQQTPATQTKATKKEEQTKEIKDHFKRTRKKQETEKPVEDKTLEKKEKESSGKNSSFDFDKEVGAYITAFFKQINRKKPGRKPKRDPLPTLEESIPGHKETIYTGTDAEENEKRIAKRQASINAAKPESDFVKAFMDAVKKLDAKISTDAFGKIAGQFVFEDGKVKISDIKLEFGVTNTPKNKK